MLKWSIKITSQNETVKPLISKRSDKRKCQLPYGTTFPPGSAPGQDQVGKARWGIISLPRESKIKDLRFLWAGGQKEGERKGLGMGKY